MVRPSFPLPLSSSSSLFLPSFFRWDATRTAFGQCECLPPGLFTQCLPPGVLHMRRRTAAASVCARQCSLPLPLLVLPSPPPFFPLPPLTVYRPIWRYLATEPPNEAPHQSFDMCSVVRTSGGLCPGRVAEAPVWRGQLADCRGPAEKAWRIEAAVVGHEVR